jgi:uncharacterized surface protein with fasciclin (FAS1) repeats
MTLPRGDTALASLRTQGETSMRDLERILTVGGLGLFLLAGCSSNDGGETASTTTETETTGGETMAETEPTTTESSTGDIVDVAVAAGSFETLVQAVQAADLVETLKSPGPFTVFAPTDEAFAALPEGALEGLLADQEKLRAVLLYHVVQGEVMAADVVNLSEAQTVQGGTLPISVEGDAVMVGNATVVQADVDASNGVIHVIDTVLLPPEG